MDFSPEGLVELLTASRKNNSAAGLSGMLLYCSQSFLQVLEGDPDALTETYGRIKSDNRHENLRLLMDAQTSSPLFPDWTMGFADVDEEDLADSVDGFVAETDYPLVNPDLVTSGEVAQRLLIAYAQNRVA